MRSTSRRSSLWLARVGLLGLACCSAIAASLPAERPEIATAFASLMSGYGSGDAEAVKRAWAPDSPWLRSFLDMATAMHEEAEDVKYDHVHIANWRVDPPKAEITVQFQWRWKNAKGELTSHEIVWQVRFVRLNEVWFVWAWRPVGEQVAQLANELLKAPDRASRSRILADQREYLVPMLVQKYIDVGLQSLREENYTEAIRVEDIAIEVGEVLADDDQLGSAYFARGVAAVQQRQFADALKYFEATRTRFEAASDDAGDARANLGIGGALAELGRNKEAEEALHKSQALASKAHDRETEAGALKNLGVLLQRQGDLSRAYENLAAADQMTREEGPSEVTAGVRIDLGVQLADQGRYAEALERLAAGLKAAEAIGNRREIRRAHQHLGQVYLALGDLDRSLKEYDQAVPADPDRDLFIRALTSDDKAAAAEVLTGLGSIYLERRDYTKASLAFLMTRLIVESESDKLALARARANAGVVFDTAGEHEKAAEEYAASEKLFAELGNWQERAALLINLGFLYLDTGELGKAGHDFGIAQASAAEHHDVNLAFRAAWGLGATYRAERQWERAAQALSEAADKLEQVRITVPEPLLKTSFLARYAQLFYLLADCQLHLRDADAVAKAFGSSERGKARSLIELMQKAGTTNARGVAALSAANPAAIIAAIGQLLAKQRAVAIVSYFIGTDGSWAFVITAGEQAGAARVQAIPLLYQGKAVGRREVSDLAEHLLRECSQPFGHYEPYATELYKVLLGPLKAALPAGASLVVVPDGPLTKIPFQVLRTGAGKFLIDEHKISYAPSVAALVATLQRRKAQAPGDLLLALARSKFPEGRPDLPWAEREATSIGGVFRQPENVHLGPSATKTLARELMPKADYVHVATHGEFNDREPLLSGLALAQGSQDTSGFLSAQDLMALDLNRVKLLTLSACETGRGQQRDGEGLLGLTWAALVAGAPAVLVSQWSLSDEAASALMSEFYSELRAPGGGGSRDLAQALSNAEATVRKSRPHPYYWAPFIVTGSWLN